MTMIKSEGGILYESPSEESDYRDIILHGTNWMAILTYKGHPMLPPPDWTGFVFYFDQRGNQSFHSGHQGSKGELK